MKTIVRVLLLSITFITISSHAQTCALRKTSSRELGKENFEQARMLYKKMLESPNWKKADSISKFLVTKYAGTIPPALDDDSLYIPWIKENLYLTKFNSIDEVLSLRNEWKAANVEVQKENLPLYELMGKASKEQIEDIIQPFIQRTNEYFLNKH